VELEANLNSDDENALNQPNKAIISALNVHNFATHFGSFFSLGFQLSFLSSQLSFSLSIPKPKRTFLQPQ
jgi:hypothetical protein